MTRKTDTGLPTSHLDLELKRQLREIGSEEQPEKLLILARRLQALLRERKLDDEQ